MNIKKWLMLLLKHHHQCSLHTQIDEVTAQRAEEAEAEARARLRKSVSGAVRTAEGALRRIERVEAANDPHSS